jgi:hypothetical protein
MSRLCRALPLVQKVISESHSQHQWKTYKMLWIGLRKHSLFKKITVLALTKCREAINITASQIPSL